MYDDGTEQVFPCIIAQGDVHSLMLERLHVLLQLLL